MKYFKNISGFSKMYNLLVIVSNLYNHNLLVTVKQYFSGWDNFNWTESFISVRKVTKNQLLFRQTWYTYSEIIETNDLVVINFLYKNKKTEGKKIFWNWPKV